MCSGENICDVIMSRPMTLRQWFFRWTIARNMCNDRAEQHSPSHISSMWKSFFHIWYWEKNTEIFLMNSSVVSPFLSHDMPAKKGKNAIKIMKRTYFCEYMWKRNNKWKNHLIKMIFGTGKKGKREAYCTWYSQAVTHPSTNQARRCLTSVIGREPVFSTWYGRRQVVQFQDWYLYCQHYEHWAR